VFAAGAVFLALYVLRLLGRGGRQVPVGVGAAGAAR